MKKNNVKVNVNVTVNTEGTNNAVTKNVSGHKALIKAASKKKCRENAKSLARDMENPNVPSTILPPSTPFYLDDSMTEKERAAAIKKAVKKSGDCWTTVMVPIAAMAMDSYHRDPLRLEGRRKSIKLEKDFSKEKFTPVVLSYRDGILWIIDGARETLAAYRRGITVLPARILTGKTRGEEANLFETQGENQIAVTPVQSYKAKLYENDELALRIDRLCQKLGITVTSTGGNVERPLRAIATVMNVADNLSPYAVAWIFTAIDLSRWLDDRSCLTHALSSYFIRAFASVYSEGVREGRTNAYLCKLVNTLRCVDPKMVAAYGKLQNPSMSKVGYLTVVLKDIARGKLTANDIYDMLKGDAA